MKYSMWEYCFGFDASEFPHFGTPVNLIGISKKEVIVMGDVVKEATGGAKPGWKSTEFFVLVGLYAIGMLKLVDLPSWTYAVATPTYILARTLVKLNILRGTFGAVIKRLPGE
jgi:hypothetical protein